MRNLAQLDYQYAMAAQATLAADLASIVDSGNTSAGANVVDVNGNQPYDVNGNAVNPYADAVAAYTSNKVRMSGDQTQLLPGSLKITLGYVPSIYTSSSGATALHRRSNTSRSAYGDHLPNLAIFYNNNNPMISQRWQATPHLSIEKSFQTTFPVEAPQRTHTRSDGRLMPGALDRFATAEPGNPVTRTVHAHTADRQPASRI